MKRIVTGCLLVLLLLATGVRAQAALTGKWQGTTANGAALALDLTATETALTGTLTRNDQTVKISDGKVSKNRFTFTATLSDQPEAFTGNLAGDEITIWMDRQGPEKAIVLKRVKDKG